MAKVVPFVPDMVFVTESSERMEYSSKNYYDGKTVKRGQIKLQLGATLWLVDHWNTDLYPQIALVVAGGATDEHYRLILDMFPGIVRLDLWDSRDKTFILEGSEYEKSGRLVIVKKRMAEDNVKQYYSSHNDLPIFFVSDIRTTVTKSGENIDTIKGKPEYEDTIWEDMKLQQRLVVTLNPVKALLKFRVPFPIKGMTLKEPQIEYLRGVIYKQCFTDVNSAEMRLACSRIGEETWDTTFYDRLEFEEKMMYYNIAVRQDREVQYANSVNSSVDLRDDLLLPCFDTCYLLYVIDKYLYFAGYDEDDKDKRYAKVMNFWQWMVRTLGRNEKRVFDSYRAATLRDRQVTIPEAYEHLQSDAVTECTVKVPSSLTDKKYMTLSFDYTRGIIGESPLTYGM